MGACDAGRCCKGNTCSDDKKCCCTAGKKGTHTAGEVCRTASCQYSSGNCDDNVNVCECESNGGTLSQSCDPCANVVCDLTLCKHCVNGDCVSFCTDLCAPCVFNGTTGVCQPIQCQQCEVCLAGSCVPTGQPCGGPCCGDGECCDPETTQCVPSACDPPCPDCYTCQCGDCVLTSECSATVPCSGSLVCVDCECVPPTCCVSVPSCGPHTVTVIEGSFTCETVTYDYMGTPCTETRYPLDCAESKCTYDWDGSSYSLVGCSVHTTQGRLILPNADCCTSSGCPATLSGSYTTAYRDGISCENPLP